MSLEKQTTAQLLDRIFEGIHVARKRGESKAKHEARMQKEYQALSGRRKQTITLRVRKALA